jgi:16S rRNA (cytidine1402-2'-O)-methyltransferase
MGTLHVVGIPAADPKDVTRRALRVLRAVGLIVTSNTLCAQKFLTFHGIGTPLVACPLQKAAGENTEETVEIEIILQRLAHEDVALLFTEASWGNSTLTWNLVRAAVERGFAITSVPGPSLAVTALVTSGLPADTYVSLGVLPSRNLERRQLLGSVAAGRRTLVAFEMSDRLSLALHDVVEILGDRCLILSPLEADADEIWRGTASEALAYFKANPPPGKWALVISGSLTQTAQWPEERVRSELERLLVKGMSRKEAARQVAGVSGWRPRDVYRLAARFHV